MADVLDQSEVDALLAAVGSSEGASDIGVAAGPVMRGPAKDVGPYDFKRPERVSKDQMRALHSIHEAFARNFGASLSAFLRTIVETRVATAEQMTYSEFIHSLPSPTCFNLMSCAPLTGKICLEISPLIIYPIVDRLLGGTNADMFIPQRPLTAIEMRLANKIINRALENLSDAWKELVELVFEVTDVESNPHLVQIVAPNEIVVVIGFEIKMGARAGTMSLCIPFNVIEPVISKLATQSWLAYSKAEADVEEVRRVTGNLRRANIEVRAYLGGTEISVSDLLNLAPGDIIQLDKLMDEDLILQVHGKPKFAGRLGKLRGKRALQITRDADATEGV